MRSKKLSKKLRQKHKLLPQCSEKCQYLILTVKQVDDVGHAVGDTENDPSEHIERAAEEGVLHLFGICILSVGGFGHKGGVCHINITADILINVIHGDNAVVLAVLKIIERKSVVDNSCVHQRYTEADAACEAEVEVVGILLGVEVCSYRFPLLVTTELVGILNIEL